MSISAFIVRVPEAEPLVASLRERFDPVAKIGVPEHITILVPFMAPAAVTAGVRREMSTLFAAIPSFDFTLNEVKRWPTTTWLAVDPAAPFVHLTEAVVRRYPAFPPYGGRFTDIVPHLTVADGDAASADLAERELRDLFARSGPVHARVTEVEWIEDSTGLWRTMARLPLGMR